MKITATPIIADERMTQAEILQHDIDYARNYCSVPIENAIGFEAIAFKIKEVKFNAHSTEMAHENLFVYFYGTRGECAKTPIVLEKGKTSYEIAFDEKLLKLCMEANLSGRFDICRIGFSTLNDTVEFTWN